MIELVHLRKEYEKATPLADVNAVINDGDVIAVIGPSGTGKSTLLYCINMLELPTSGKILLDGVDITAPGQDLTQVHRRMGMVFQHFDLFGHLTVIENLMAGPVDILGKPKQEAYDDGMKYLTNVGLEEYELQYPDELSGGQKQRVAIARTLAMETDIILLDEPTSALDPNNVAEVKAVIRDLAKSGRTMMIVTHDMTFARSIANRVFYMDQGGIYEDGTPEQIFEHPRKELTRRFINKIKVFELDIKDEKFDFVTADNEFEHWCIKNDIQAGIRYRIRLAMEEIAQQMLLPRGNVFPMHILAEYSAEDKEATVTISYSGAEFDPSELEDKMSYDLLKKLVRDIKYSYEGDAEYQNIVTVFISDAR